MDFLGLLCCSSALNILTSICDVNGSLMSTIILFLFNSQSKRALKSIVQYCTHLTALEPLLYVAPNNILKHVLYQYSKVS